MTDDANAMPYPESAPDLDAVSDPAKDDTEGQDWSTEGGATPRGPATDVEADATEAGVDELRQPGADASESE
jgi:hypothetical protein